MKISFMRHKFWCMKCDHVAKGLGFNPMYCPGCREKMRNMGRIWKPGPKGNRMRYYPEGWGKNREGATHPDYDKFSPYWWEKVTGVKRRVNGKIKPRL